MEATSPPPEPSLATAPPPSAPAKAGGGLRAGAVLLVLVLLFAGAVMFVAGSDINDTPTLQEVKDGTPLNDGEYFDGSSTKRSVVTGLLYGAGVFAALAAIAALAFVVTGRRGRIVLVLIAIGIVLAGIALLL